MMINLTEAESFIAPLQARINHCLERYLPSKKTLPEHLHEAMHYAVFNGGKRIRPLLVYATGLSFQTDLALLDFPAMAIELIHCYSLVHDDLPAMDNDDYRRGKLSCHKAYDEATAILVGDALQTLAFELLTQSPLSSPQQIALIKTLSQASGSQGMAGGQQLDLDHKNKLLSPTQVETIHHLKTGALFQASLKMGLITANVKDEYVTQQLDQFAYQIGLAFQHQDDYFDADSSASKAKAHSLFRQAQDHLNCLSTDSQALQTILDYLQKRDF